MSLSPHRAHLWEICWQEEREEEEKEVDLFKEERNYQEQLYVLLHINTSIDVMFCSLDFNNLCILPI